MGLQCLKITEKVSFNIASEASYVYIFSRQKFIINTKNGPFLLAVKQVTFNKTTIGRICQN